MMTHLKAMFRLKTFKSEILSYWSCVTLQLFPTILFHAEIKFNVHKSEWHQWYFRGSNSCHLEIFVKFKKSTTLQKKIYLGMRGWWSMSFRTFGDDLSCIPKVKMLSLYHHNYIAIKLIDPQYFGFSIDSMWFRCDYNNTSFKSTNFLDGILYMPYIFRD